MATQIVDFNNLKNSGGTITEEELKYKIEHVEELDEDNDCIMLNMSDMSDLAEAMAMVKVGLERISDITQVDISEEAAQGIVSALS